MPTLGKAYVQIVPSAEGISGSISGLMKGESENAGKEAGSSFASKFVSFGMKALAAAGIGKMIGAALNEGGQLQQSLGGVETLFDTATSKAADIVKANASKAFETVGVSANEYMQNVTSFSASLISSLGGDTQKAAEAANTAMIDMSDNANKMGTSLESIQTAYQGFAKQNYTMLDNLKLGYGGTKTEMQRLLKDAQKITGVKYDMDNLADVYEAIHVIQGELGITGTTAKEASVTLEGSANAMKAAFKNLLGGIATGGDVGQLLSDVANTTSTWLFGNFLPMVGQVVANIPGLIAETLQTGVPLLIENVGSMITQITDWFNNGGLASLASTGTSIINTIISGITTALPVMWDALTNMVSSAGAWLGENLGPMLNAGIEMLTKLVSGLWNNRQALFDKITEVMNMAVEFVKSIDWPGLGSQVIEFITNGVQALFDNLPDLLFDIGNTAWNIVTTIDWEGLGKLVIDTIAAGINALIDAIPKMLKSIWDAGSRVVTEIDWAQIGKDVVNGIVSGIGNAGHYLWESLKGVATNALQKAKDMLQIGSPSKVFADEVGQWIPAGIAEGIEDNQAVLNSAIDDMAYMTTEARDAFGSMEPSSSVNAPITVTININGNVDDVEALAQEVADKINQEIIRKDTVFA